MERAITRGAVKTERVSDQEREFINYCSSGDVLAFIVAQNRGKLITGATNLPAFRHKSSIFVHWNALLAGLRAGQPIIALCWS